MKVTKFQYPLEDRLIQKIDLMINRCVRKNPKDDVVLVIDGKEGIGKTSVSVAIAYYVSDKTKRKFSEKNIFFNSEQMLKFAQSTENKIIIWDEPATDSLSTDWAKTGLRNIIRLLMTCRKKRHFIMINMTRFFRFPEDIAVQRTIGMLHLYRKNEKNNQTRFLYVKGKKIESLFRNYKFKKKADFKKFASKGCRGAMPDVLNPDYNFNVLSEFNIKDYEKKKDSGIEDIGKPKESFIESQRRKRLLTGIMNLSREKKMTSAEIGKIFGFSPSRIRDFLCEINVEWGK